MILTFQFRFFRRERKVVSQSWDGVLDQLERLDIEGLRTIADCYLNPIEDQLRIEPYAMWETVGGSEGLRKMLHNANVMLDLAMYAERWHDVTGRVISEMLRRDAARIRKAVRKIQIAMITRRRVYYLGFELQEAIATYWLMRGRLLGMYSDCHAGLLPRLSEAL